MARERARTGWRCARWPGAWASRTTRRTATSPTARQLARRDRRPGHGPARPRRCEARLATVRRRASTRSSGPTPAAGDRAGLRRVRRSPSPGCSARRSRARSTALDGEPRTAGDGGPYALLNEVLDELVEVRLPGAERRPGADVICWAGVHGFAVLAPRRAAARQAPGRSARPMMTRFFDIVERGLGAVNGWRARLTIANLAR